MDPEEKTILLLVSLIIIGSVAYAHSISIISRSSAMRLMATGIIPAVYAGIDAFPDLLKNERKKIMAQTASKYAFIIISSFLLSYAVFGAGLFSPVSIGILTAVLAYVLQKPLSNVFAWIYIITFRPFNIGDRIEVSGTIGDVYSIDPLATRIKLRGDNHEATGTYVNIPNETFILKTLRNYTHPSRYFWDVLPFSMTYESDIEKAEEIITEACKRVHKIPEADEEQIKSLKKKYLQPSDPLEPFTRVNLSDSSVVISLHYLVKVDVVGATRKRIIKEVMERVREEKDVKFAYPHITVVRKK